MSHQPDITHGTSAAFAFTAADMLASGNASKAVHLCADGIRMFPDYLGGYIVLAQAYDVLALAQDARTIRDEAQRKFPWLPHVGPLADAPASVHDAEPEPEPEPEPEMPMQAPALTLIPSISANAAPLAPPRPAVERDMRHSLRIIDTAHLENDQRIIRSATVRLIPGLEFTTLRFEGVKQRGRRAIQRLSDPPRFRDFHVSMKPYQHPTEDATTSTGKRPLSLEELASRLERVRMPRPTDAQRTPPPPSPAHPPQSGTSLVTETIARIYEGQGAFDLAIEAYRTLQRQRPDRHDHYQTLIDAIVVKRAE